MSSKAGLLLASFVAGLCVVVSGCAPSANLSLQFTPDTSEAYDVTTEVTQDYRFEQPTMDKLDEMQSSTVITVGFTQTVTDVDENGIATADVQIDALSVLRTNRNEVRISFDSAKAEDHANPLHNLIGQHYTVRISPEGKVVSFDSTVAQQAVVGGHEEMAKHILNEGSIRQRHEIPALWGFDEKTPLNQSWSQVIGSPPGMMASKNFRQVYTLTDVFTRNGQKLAVVEMVGTETADAPITPSRAGVGLGPFASMFDTLDDYTGTLLLNQNTGTVLGYDETLVSTLMAQEIPARAPADAEPDTLTMRLTHRISIQKR